MNNESRKNKQLVVDKGNGDCFRACLTSLLGLPNTDGILNYHSKDWMLKWDKFLEQFGLSLHYEQKSCWRYGYWIASVKSKNYKNVTHAIIMKGTEVFFDPSTKKRYRTNRSLLGKDIVRGGFYLEAMNPSKLYKLEEFKKKVNHEK